MMTEKVDEIINRALSKLDIPEDLKTFDEMDEQARMMLACMFLINNSFITVEDKAALKEWLKETAMMA